MSGRPNGPYIVKNLKIKNLYLKKKSFLLFAHTSIL